MGKSWNRKPSRWDDERGESRQSWKHRRSDRRGKFAWQEQRRERMEERFGREPSESERDDDEQ